MDATLTPSSVATALIAITYLATSINLSIANAGPYPRKQHMTDQPTPYNTGDTLTETNAERPAADLQTAPRPLPLGLTAGMTPAAVSIVIAGALEQLLASRIVCVACASEAHARGADGAVPVNLANVIAQGNGVCFAHIQFAAGPVMPGQTASGIYLPGAGA